MDKPHTLGVVYATIVSMNTLIRALLISVIFVAPFSASALTQAELTAQIQALLAQVNALQQQIGTQTGTTNTNTGPIITVGDAGCPHISRVLKLGATGDDVIRLQQFLAQNPSIYPEGSVSGFYGALTEAAVQRWQARFNVVSSGTPDSTGYGVVGPRTAALMALQCGTGVASQVGGFIKVTPISGNAPLQVSVEATINTTRSCGATTYTLDWGDGTQVQNMPLSAGVCAEVVQNLTHTYVYGGTYPVTLTAQGQSTSATVVVNGPVRPNGGTTTTNDSLRATPSTGQSPLVVTFTGIINGNASCGGGYYTLLFGDAQTQVISYPASCSPQSFSVAHTYTGAGTRSATLIRGSVGGTVVATAPVVVQGLNETFGSVTATPSIDGNIRSLNLTFNVTGCTGFNIEWGDGTVQNEVANSGCSTTASVQRVVNHVYAAGGTYTIRIKRGTSLQQLDTLSVTINSNGTTQTALLVSPSSGVTPLTVTATFPSQYQSFVSTECTNTTARFGGQTFSINWGDGTYPNQNGKNYPCLSHTYTAPGTYTVTGRIYNFSDTNQFSGSFTQDVWTGTATVVVTGSTSQNPSITVVAPTTGAITSRGSTMTLAWNSQNAPSNAAALLRLINANTGVSAGVILRGQNPTGTYTWSVPTATAVTCPDCGGVQTVPGGSYYISAELYTPSTAWLGDTYPPANPVYPTYIANGRGGVFTVQ